MAAFLAWIGLLSVATGGAVAPVEPWQWAAPFAGASVLYLFGSALTLVTAHPWRWLGGGAVAYVFLNVFRSVGSMLPLVDAINSILWGTYGLVTVLTGLVQTLDPGPTRPWMVPDLGAWLASTGIWLVMAVGAVVWAAYRQPER